MTQKRNIAVIILLYYASSPLWGGTGSPSDGLLSFILVLGFLLILFGILHLMSLLKKRLDNILEGIF